MKKEKIILDTNLWISFIISDKLKSLDIILKENNVKFLYSSHLLEEIDNVIRRPKFKKYFSESNWYLLIELFTTYGIQIDVVSNLAICRDSKDNFLLNLAIDGKADFLITGDNDLLVLEKIENTRIVTFSDYINNKPIK
ncbi:MAG TPA: putative toxin-antitoxin system toxin component, PIN family [Flavobacterium sp.]|nr:putative toxin-antitoxin system toxin component, PIN family [Flavobacterium sp.]HAT75682.1 putative toxin-antitoxin system toxin component, PIN family [Flavobacterium sp.]HAT80954.1 putative toxin-antitoxin system toxin component, PIN family [Flavobacterium sp.]